MLKRKGYGGHHQRGEELPRAAIRFAGVLRRFAMILCVTSVSLTAQWPNRPTPGLPRTADGKANLSAPAPRSADGKPDLSGVWMVRNSGSLFYLTQGLKP